MSEYYDAINNPITLGKDEMIIRNHVFNLPVDDLIKNSKRTRLYRRNQRNVGNKVIPRRQNAWIIYLRDKSAKLKGFQSKQIAKMWQEEPKEIVEVYEAVARLSVQKHIEKYPDYKYRPRTPRTGKNNKKQKNISNVPPMTPPITPPLYDLRFPTLESAPPGVILDLIKNCDVCKNLLQTDDYLNSSNFVNASLLFH
ncbi:hypothetical protein RclHR1_00570019 [Rhizophagus clarus]|uniref:Mating type protein MAT1-1-3 n=1 Tax=Rhizophagus clarus TaxID=94130 RepID=A0A2Z6RUG7_9GLOM|nr:hypothetical protein RclHR1_00570019 [Rhizophagus clarus]GET04214.1 mating type protein MAT1-1-3 [Rhizophagus clarus]